jgi:hypothetical protein
MKADIALKLEEFNKIIAHNRKTVKIANENGEDIIVL